MREFIVDFTQRLSGISSSSNNDEAIITQRIARLRSILACFRVCNKQINVSSNLFERAHTAYQMELAEEAILGQRSAASFATGPVIPDPFISPLGFTITPALSANQPQQQPLTLEVKEHSVLSSPGLALTHHNSGHD